jgi:hypothetical protein
VNGKSASGKGLDDGMRWVFKEVSDGTGLKLLSLKAQHTICILVRSKRLIIYKSSKVVAYYVPTDTQYKELRADG